jgi:hypothetical protein
MGLVVFAGEARFWIPLTHDLDSFRGLLDEVDTDAVKLGGTDLAAALRKALEPPTPTTQDHRRAAADGRRGPRRGRPQAAAELGKDGLVVHTVGYGSALGSKITVASTDQAQFLRDKDGQEVISRMDPTACASSPRRPAASSCAPRRWRCRSTNCTRSVCCRCRSAATTSGEEQQKQARYQWVLLPLLVLLLWEMAMAGGRR